MEWEMDEYDGSGAEMNGGRYMATTVNAAFEEFMKNIVNLDPNIVSAARVSRDNLLNNIYKYAQAGSRVYLNVEHDGQDVRIIFRNMSAFPLEMSPEELEERFTRGDKSRHMEGNGLGLSIAKSLTELQNGDMQIVTDGDLFKVVITLPETE